MYFNICFFSIVVICIDYSEWLGKDFLCCQYSVTCSPWFGTVCRFLKVSWKIVDLLECVSNFCDLLDTVANDSAEFVLNIFTDDKYHFVESCFQCIMDGIVHDDLALRSYRCELLDTFSKTASNSCCHDYQCCLLHITFPPDYYNLYNSLSVIIIVRSKSGKFTPAH